MEQGINFKEQIVSLKNIKELEILFKYLTIPKYGSITIVFHDGNAVQIEKNEKFRL